MKKEVILSSLILMNPVSMMAKAEIQTLRQQVIEKKLDLNHQYFLSTESFESVRTIYDENGEMISIPTTYRIEIRFKTYEDDVEVDSSTTTEIEKMEFEATVSYLYSDALDKSRREYSGSQYMINQKGDDRFDLYDCDSTLSCSLNYGRSNASIKKINGSTYLIIDDPKEVFHVQRESLTFKLH